ncbi:MAG: YraN family protein [Bacteroidales bacterium]|jgi:putative endonuclease|nr:YraN family protein [Bacteroidales bacterium]
MRIISSDSIQKGKKGEDIAVKYLIGKGYIIKHRNYRIGHKEIDIIAELPDTIVFIEVKWRRSAVISSPLDAVNYRKQLHLFQAANYYVVTHNIKKNVRFDVIGIVSDENMEHIEGAFSPFGG